MSTSKLFQVNLPCKTYIKKYVISIYGQERLINKQPVFGLKADRSTHVGFMASLALEKQEYESRHKNDRSPFGTLEDQLVLFVSRWQFQNIGFEVSRDAVHVINAYLEELFKEALYFHCQRYVKHDVRYSGYKEAIESFATRHDIVLEYDIPYDSLKRIEARHRDRLQKQKNLAA